MEDTQQPELIFRGHSHLQINLGDTTLLCDPWAGGKVFNNSWALLKEHPLDPASFMDNLCIWVSHERPDHLHFPTLKAIRASRKGKISFYYRKQSNKNVCQAMAELGFDVHEIEAEQTVEVGSNLKLTSLPFGTDCAAMIEAGGKFILNQNDLIAPTKMAKDIKRRFKKIDAWFFQFSLAGYYGNENEPLRLHAAHDSHLDLIKKYHIFQPDIYVPFASFVYFCKRGNFYLNKYRVHPKEAVAMAPKGSAQLLWFDDRLIWQGCPPNRNQENIERWNSVWEQSLNDASSKSLDQSHLNEAAQDFLNEITSQIPRFLRPGKVKVRLRESQGWALIDLRHKRFVSNSQPVPNPDAEVGDDDLLFFFKFPWGADTLNITGNLLINNQFRWRWLAYLKHANYIYRDRPGFIRGIIALIGALVRSWQYKAVKY